MFNFNYLLLAPASNGTPPPNEAGEVELIAYLSDYGMDGDLSGIPATLRIRAGEMETVTVGGRFDRCLPQIAYSDEAGKITFRALPSSAYSPEIGGGVRPFVFRCERARIEERFFVLPDGGGNLAQLPEVE